eukprot:7027362-Prymnesium_polylepis.1
MTAAAAGRAPTRPTLRCRHRPAARPRRPAPPRRPSCSSPASYGSGRGRRSGRPCARARQEERDIFFSPRGRAFGRARWPMLSPEAVSGRYARPA